ncbi:MAG: AraC family transcriptional regulator [Cyanobacteria bacterium P01_D01_bin.44]
MSLDLTLQDLDALEEAEQQATPVASPDSAEAIYTVPPQIGSGYHREIELQPGMELRIFNYTYRDVALRIPEDQHLVQFIVHLSGVADSGDLVYQDAYHSYIGGSGIQRSVTSFFAASEHQIGVNIHVQPQLFQQLFGTPAGELPPELRSLVPKQDDWQRVISPKTTAAVRSVVQQIIDCPFTGLTKRLYFQGKVFELMALQLEGAIAQTPHHQPTPIKPDLAARIHQAAAILRSNLETPPSQTDLAQRVGVCDRTLRRGFKQIFGTTVVGYLTQQRLQQAEQTLRDGSCTVAQVANQVGYAHLGHFAAAFKRQFGITPSQCVSGVRSR